MNQPARERGAAALAGLDVSRPERFRANEHWPLFARLRREDPVHYCADSPYGPYWSITRYDDVVEVERNYRQFSSLGNVIIGDVPPEFDAPAFATADPPEHTRERRAALPAVSPKRLARLEPEIRAGIARVLDGLPRAGSFDWVEHVAVELTNQMVALLFGFPWAERALLPYWSEVLVTTPGAGAITETWEERAAVIDQYRQRISSIWRERASGPAGDDLLSVLARHPDTAAMIDDPRHLIGTVSMVAGANEAARGALAGSVVAFDAFPAEWQKLRAKPALAANAAAEIVRWQTPIAHMRRTATMDVGLHGKQISRGDRVVMWYCSANRDEACFDAADELRIDRANARRHLGYGIGIHRCLGKHVAELQLRLLLETMRERFRRIELVTEPLRKLSNFSAGYEAVRVRVVP